MTIETTTLSNRSRSTKRDFKSDHHGASPVLSEVFGVK
jgi:hypothetical protein